MSTRDESGTGDYGYDLVHEEIGRGRERPGGTAPRPAARPPADGKDDVQGDYAYDEAHDF